MKRVRPTWIPQGNSWVGPSWPKSPVGIMISTVQRSANFFTAAFVPGFQRIGSVSRSMITKSVVPYETAPLGFTTTLFA